MDFCLLFTSLGFFSTITRPTRVSSNSKTLFDNVWTNNIGAVKNSGVILSGISDHYPIFVNQCLTNELLDTRVTYRVRIRNGACYDKFRTLLSEENWDGICNQIDADAMFDSFNTTLVSIYNDSFPYVTRKTKPLDILKPYINADLRELIKEKHRLEKKFKRHPITYGDQYRTLRNRVAKLTAKAKRKYFSDKMLQANSRPKLIWKVLNDALGRKSKSTDVKQLIDEDSSSEIISGNKNIAQKFNNYFANIGSTYGDHFSDSSAFENYMSSANVGEPFKFSTVSLESLEAVVGSLKNSSPGHDEIPSSILKEFFHLLGPVMLKICNKSLEQGIFPDSLKKAKIIPIFKAGDRKKQNNYRPISILCSFGKILEKIVVSQLETYLNENNILTPHQFGFRRGISTENAVQNLLKQVYHAFDNGEFVISIFLDLTKAFDLVNRSYLLRKLYLYGVRDIENYWIRSYLTGRVQFTNIGDSCSSVLPVERGVPQGSIFGPLLFLIFINDLCNSSQFLKFCMYADDTSLLCSSKNIYELIGKVNIELGKINSWFVANQLIINESKTKFMVFHRSKKLVPTVLPPIYINNASINRVYSFKFLGVVLDVNLKFKDHVLNVTKKISKFIPLIYRIRKYLNKPLLMQLYFGLIYPNLIYCITVWGASNKNVINPLQISQNKLVRAICGADRMDSARPLFNSLRIFNVKEVYNYMVCNYIYKSISRNENIFVRNESQHNTRQAVHEALHVPYTHSTQTMQSITYSGTRAYNTVPVNIRRCESFVTFKYRLKAHILSNNGG